MKHALNGGIFSALAVVTTYRNQHVAITDFYSKHRNIYQPNEWRPTREEAIAYAEEMRERKLKMLVKAIQQVEKLEITVTDRVND